MININYNWWLELLFFIFFFAVFVKMCLLIFLFFSYLLFFYYVCMYIYTLIICHVGGEAMRQQIACHFCLPRATTVMFLLYHAFVQDAGQWYSVSRNLFISISTLDSLVNAYDKEKEKKPEQMNDSTIPSVSILIPYKQWAFSHLFLFSWCSLIVKYNWNHS